MAEEAAVTGTYVWYYLICQRETWLMIHQIAPDEEDENIEIGRFIHEYRYGRAKKEIEVGTIKVDQIANRNGQLIVKEIKKSSKFKQSATYQLLYYLYTFKKMGISAKGELRFPEERRTEEVVLTESAIEKLEEIMDGIKKLAALPIPPHPKKITFCRKCAYREFCWAEG